MPLRKPPPFPSPVQLAPGQLARGEVTRRRVLDAAERLLAMGGAAFSMRELAAEAGVSFATPFNRFGGKTAIMQALSARRIKTMAERFAAAEPAGDAADRALAAMDVATAVMLEAPDVNRAVIGALGAPGDELGVAQARSRALWALALGGGDGLVPDLAPLARATLPIQLALVFRGALSFWCAGEITDADLGAHARAATAAMLLGFVGRERRQAMLDVLEG